MADVNPGTLAYIDQLAAELRELVELVRAHQAHCPVKPAGICVGYRATRKLDRLDPYRTRLLLDEAIAQLAQAAGPPGGRR